MLKASKLRKKMGIVMFSKLSHSLEYVGKTGLLRKADEEWIEVAEIKYLRRIVEVILRVQIRSIETMQEQEQCQK